jgi:phosphoribosylaminoimidazole-succinocarboxamide synthase
MVRTSVILQYLPHVLKTIQIEGLGEQLHGKVRDFYIKDGKRILITTDRQSAFNSVLGHIPYKGSVLNLLSKFWFEKTKKIVINHMISVPHSNVMITNDCKPTNIEMIVRGYLTGVTVTSPWGNYEKGERIIYGIKFPDGLKKNQKLPHPILTPTTHGGAKGSHADERLTKDEIIKRKIIDRKLYEQMERVALALFDYGSKLCKKRGLILVDTKYEFGLYRGKLMMIDEIHTPDSSRFWIAKTYKERFEKGLEPENFDKEFLRLWYVERGYSGDGTPPPMTKELIAALSKRYISVYEKITGKKFKSYRYPIEKKIIKILSKMKYENGKII